MQTKAKTSANFAIDASAGFRHDLNDRTALTLAYMYSYLGKQESSTQGVSGSKLSLRDPLRYRGHAHNILIGIVIKA